MRCPQGLPVVALLLASPLWADDAHYQNFALGAQGAALGGAFGAVADDASGLWYNPSGLVDGARHNVSINTTLYGIDRQLTYVKELDPARLLLELHKYPLTGAEINVIPAAGGASFGLGAPAADGSFRHALGFGMLVPSFRTGVHYVNVEDAGGSIHNVSRVDDRTFVVAAGYAWRHSPRLRFGAAAHAVSRNVSMNDTFHWYAAPSGDGGQPAFLHTSSELELSDLSLRLALGVKLRLDRGWSLGLTLSSPSSAVWQSGTFNVSVTRGNFDDGQSTYATDVESRRYQVRWLGSVLPADFRLGLAHVDRSHTLALDLTLHGTTRYTLVADTCSAAGSDLEPLCQLDSLTGASGGALAQEVQRRTLIPTEVPRQLTANVAVGYEQLIGAGFGMAGGLYTDLSSAPAYQLDARGKLLGSSPKVSRIHHYGATLSGSHRGNIAVTRVGVCGVLGLGEIARPVRPDARFTSFGAPLMEPVPTQEFIVYLFISGELRHNDVAQ